MSPPCAPRGPTGVGGRRRADRLRRLDGSVHHIRCSGQVARNEAGRAVRMVGSNWDITERKAAEIRLEHERTQLRTLLQTIPDMESLKDREGVYLGCNVAREAAAA